MSWMLFNRNSAVGMYDRRHFCVLAGHNISHLHDVFLLNPDCSKEEIVLVFPSGTSSEAHAIEKVFLASWEVGIIDIVVFVSDPHCRAYTYVPMRGHKRRHCPDLTPVLISSSIHSESSTNDSRVTLSPENKISSMHLCEIQVLSMGAVFPAWYALTNYLEKALGASFTVTFVDIHPNISKLRPSEIQITPLLVHQELSEKFSLPAFLFYEENIFAVPRVPPSSLQWFRLLVNCQSMCGTD